MKTDVSSDKGIHSWKATMASEGNNSLCAQRNYSEKVKLNSYKEERSHFTARKAQSSNVFFQCMQWHYHCTSFSHFADTSQNISLMQQPITSPPNTPTKLKSLEKVLPCTWDQSDHQHLALGDWYERAVGLRNPTRPHERCESWTNLHRSSSSTWTQTCSKWRSRTSSGPSLPKGNEMDRRG